MECRGTHERAGDDRAISQAGLPSLDGRERVRKARKILSPVKTGSDEGEERKAYSFFTKNPMELNFLASVVYQLGVTSEDGLQVSVARLGLLEYF